MERREQSEVEPGEQVLRTPAVQRAQVVQQERQEAQMELQVLLEVLQPQRWACEVESHGHCWA